MSFNAKDMTQGGQIANMRFRMFGQIANIIFYVLFILFWVLCGLMLMYREGANKQVISSQADSLIKISRIWADFFPANTSNQPI
ncbi:hypothetical protein JYQ94_28735 (plasmid) [Klebsiella michiganensis]|nr:hypothetical protein [Klebsiella michiganensis]MBN4045253.1 hypothetical protein [Klebsiella michiganensis]